MCRTLCATPLKEPITIDSNSDAARALRLALGSVGSGYENGGMLN